MPSNETLNIRIAEQKDLVRIVQMLADDPLGSQREKFADPLPSGYSTAFTAIDKDPNNELLVLCLNEEVIGVLQMTFIPYLTYQGSWRALVEGVRVDSRFRSRGFGKPLFEWSIQRARERNCHMLQLTSNKSRPNAIKFYESLGFVASHEGMKLELN